MSFRMRNPEADNTSISSVNSLHSSSLVILDFIFNEASKRLFRSLLCQSINLTGCKSCSSGDVLLGIRHKFTYSSLGGCLSDYFSLVQGISWPAFYGLMYRSSSRQDSDLS